MRALLSMALLLVSAAAASAVDHWPDFRGPRGDGRIEVEGLPLEWSESKNVRWKTALPHVGWSSPVVCDGLVWMTTATSQGHRMFALCVDAETGKLRYNVELFEIAEPEPKNALNSYASPSPVVEPGRVYIHFGTYGTACLDTASGQVLWTRRDLNLDHKEGPGSSPVLWKDLLIFHCDGQDVRYAVALDKHTGKTVWKSDRTIDVSHKVPDQHKAYSTPVLVENEGQTLLVGTAAQGAVALDPATGREVWKVLYDGYSNVSRPVAGKGVVFINTGYNRPQLWAVRLGGTGDVTQTHVEWKFDRSVPAMPSVVLVDGLIYMVHDQGVATCLDAATGETVWSQRLGGSYSASPLAAAGRIYFFSRDGKTTVIKPGREFEVLAVNELEDGFMASPAVLGKALLLRTQTHLYRVEE